MASNPKTGEMLECKKCSCKIQVVQGCACDPGCAQFLCCGQAMENTTEPTVRTAGTDEIAGGMDLTKDPA